MKASKSRTAAALLAANGLATVLTGATAQQQEPSWKWPESKVFETVNHVRAGRDLTPRQPQPLGKRSFSGRLNVRMPSYLHRYLAIEAAQQSVSLNQLINLKLESPLEIAATSD